MEKLLWQLLNTAPRAPENEGGGGGAPGGDDAGKKEEENVEEQGAPGGDKEPASRFADKGLGKFRAKEEGEPADDKTPAGDRPKWLPEKFKSPEALATAYETLETKLRNSGKINPDDLVPEEGTVEAYFGEGVQLDEAVDRIGLAPDDPGLKVAADVFKRYGIGKQTATAIVKDMFKGMNEHAPTPLDPEQEMKALGPNGAAAIDGTILWLEKLDREGKLSDDDADFAIDLMGTARGVKFLNKMRGMSGERSIPMGAHIPSAGGMSPDEWHVAYKAAVSTKNYKEQERLDKISGGVFGTGAASGSPIRGMPEG